MTTPKRRRRAAEELPTGCEVSARPQLPSPTPFIAWEYTLISVKSSNPLQSVHSLTDSLSKARDSHLRCQTQPCPPTRVRKRHCNASIFLLDHGLDYKSCHCNSLAIEPTSYLSSASNTYLPAPSHKRSNRFKGGQH